MKWSNFYAILFFATLFFTSCSDSADKKESSSTEENSTSTATNSNGADQVAGQKRPDIAVQGLKGKVQVMSESLIPGEGSKKAPSKNVFKYNANGNMVELASYTSEGKVTSTVKSTYDSAGTLIKEETLLGNGTVDLVSTIKTDAKGNKIQQDDVRPNGNVMFNYKYTYRYDEKGQLIERAGYRGNGSLLFKYNFKYDDNGNRIEWLQSASDGVTGKVVYKYNDKNNLVEDTEYSRDGQAKAAHTYSYEFDKKGNWIRQKKMQDGKVIEIKERDIKYY